MGRYVALVRGINVGGRNKVPMAELRAALEDAGHRDVGTYIQSGNVLLTSGASSAVLEKDVENVIERTFGFPVTVVVRSHAQLRAVVQHAPPGFGTRPGAYHCDAIFLKSPLTVARAMKVVELRAEVDEAWPGRGVLYFRRLSARRTQSKLSRITGTPEYRLMTIRNWATTTKLLDLLGG